MLDRDRLAPDERMIFEEYGYRCVLCGFQYAVSLHEEPPRSLNPRWMDEPWRRFPLCNAHHETIQSMSRADAEEMLLHHVDIYFPGAVERIRQSVVTSTEQ